MYFNEVSINQNPVYAKANKYQGFQKSNVAFTARSGELDHIGRTELMRLLDESRHLAGELKEKYMHDIFSLIHSPSTQLNMKDRNGDTALHHAVKALNKERFSREEIQSLAALYLAKNTDPAIKNNAGKTAYECINNPDVRALVDALLRF